MHHSDPPATGGALIGRAKSSVVRQASRVGRGIRAVGRNIKFAAKYPIVMFKTRHVRRQLAAAKRSRVAKATTDAKSMGARWREESKTGQAWLGRQAIRAARAARVKNEQERFAARKTDLMNALSERAIARAKRVNALDRLSDAVAESARRKRLSPPPAKKAQPGQRIDGRFVRSFAAAAAAAKARSAPASAAASGSSGAAAKWRKAKSGVLKPGAAASRSN